jgi:hypothetical protein
MYDLQFAIEKRAASGFGLRGQDRASERRVVKNPKSKIVNPKS